MDPFKLIRIFYCLNLAFLASNTYLMIVMIAINDAEGAVTTFRSILLNLFAYEWLRNRLP